MIEQNGTPKKEQVGSLFFHVFHRFSLWLYTILCNCLPARLLTSYHALELRWEYLYTRVFGAPDGRLRRRLHTSRLAFAGFLESSKLLIVLDKLIRFLIRCPLNVFGTFFLTHGFLGAAIYFVTDHAYADDIGWGISGIAIAICSLPLLCSSKPLYSAAFGSRILGKILRSYLGLEPLQKGQDKKSRGGIGSVYAALVLGVAAGATTYVWHPATVPIVLVLAALAVLVLYIPEAGVLLAIATFPFWWVTGQSAMCAVAISGMTLISFINKLVRGKRVLHIRLLDLFVLIVCGVFVTHGIFTRGGPTSLMYGLGYTLLIAMYFPVISLMRSEAWLNRCYRLLAASGAVLSVLSVLPFAAILEFLDMIFKRVDFSVMGGLFDYYDAFFGKTAFVGGLLLMLLPMMLTEFIRKRSLTGYFWNIAWIAIGCLSVFATMHIGVWAGLGVGLVLFFFMYSYKSLSTSILLAFPAACGIAWFGELNRVLKLQHLEIVQAILDVIVTYCDAADRRHVIAQTVFNLSKDHMLGVGLGEHAVEAVFPYYAVPGMETITDMGNAYLQLLTECGWLAIIAFFAVLLLFCMCVLSYLRHGSDPTTKARMVAGFAGIAGVLVLGNYINFLGSASIFTMFWLIIALSCASMHTQYQTLARAVGTHAGTRERTDIVFRAK